MKAGAGVDETVLVVPTLIVGIPTVSVEINVAVDEGCVVPTLRYGP